LRPYFAPFYWPFLAKSFQRLDPYFLRAAGAAVGAIVSAVAIWVAMPGTDDAGDMSLIARAALAAN